MRFLIAAIELRELIEETDCDSCRADGRHLKHEHSIARGGGCYLHGARLDEPVTIEPGHRLHGRLFYCPRSMSIAVNPWFEDFVRYKNGILPRAGGWIDQDHTYTETMPIIDREIDRETAERIAKIEKEAKRRGRG